MAGKMERATALVDLCRRVGDCDQEGVHHLHGCLPTETLSRRSFRNVSMLAPVAYVPRVQPHLPADGALASPHDPGDLGAFPVSLST